MKAQGVIGTYINLDDLIKCNAAVKFDLEPISIRLEPRKQLPFRRFTIYFDLANV